jgi:hypothetical protein
MLPPENLLADYLTEHELAQQVRRSVATVRRWRQARIGPPFTLLGKKEFIYHREGARSWLRANEQAAPRAHRQRKNGAS